MKPLIFLSIITLLFIAAKCEEPSSSETCLDESKINPNGICTLEYNPVCGCDGKTYGNACQADHAGLTSWEAGECE